VLEDEINILHMFIDVIATVVVSREKNVCRSLRSVHIHTTRLTSCNLISTELMSALATLNTASTNVPRIYVFTTLGGDTVRPGGLHARIFHAFLVPSELAICISAKPGTAVSVVDVQ